MPVYDYKCAEHGVYNELATIEESDQPTKCPECGVLCARIIMMPPSILTMSKEKKQAQEKNEKSQHEPVFSNLDQRQHDHEHSSGVGCCKHKPTPSKMLLTAKGEKIFPSARPWMISH